MTAFIGLADGLLHVAGTIDIADVDAARGGVAGVDTLAEGAGVGCCHVVASIVDTTEDLECLAAGSRVGCLVASAALASQRGRAGIRCTRAGNDLLGSPDPVRTGRCGGREAVLQIASPVDVADIDTGGMGVTGVDAEGDCPTISAICFLTG